MTITQQLQQEIRLLLSCSKDLPVRVAISQLKGAGLGVYTRAPVAKGSALCLYPGVYSPGLPVFNDPDMVYLGDKILPSGVNPPETNAYVLNLQTTGGYLDALAKDGLETSPVACAHLVNHSAREEKANVHVISFWWHQILHNRKEREDAQPVIQLPNRRRCDKAPWFLHEGEIVTFEEFESSACGGAVLCASKDLDGNEELYLDYGLQAPFPKWAQGWYDQ